MAKSKQTSAPEPPVAAPPAATPSTEQLKLASRCIRNVTGCGQLEADARLSKLDPDLVIQIAELERDGKRRDTIAIIYA